MYTVGIELKFCSGHRLVDHPGKCSNYHGHNYKARIEVESETLDSNGMVIDFAHIKDPIKEWIDENWDHNMILNPDDMMWSLRLDEEFNENKMKEFWSMPKDFPEPTAENMARVLYAIAFERIAGQVKQVTLWETDTCFATYIGE